MPGWATVLLIATSAGQPQSGVRSDHASLRQIRRSLEATYLRDAPGASIAIAAGGRGFFKGSYGLADLENGTPASFRSMFRIGSLTKQFTATLALLLEAEGKLELDRRVDVYLPELQGSLNDVRVADLVAHTSGIASRITLGSELLVDGSQLVIPRLFRLLREWPSDFPAGTAWRYSDAGYYLLGLILQRVSNTSYEDLLKHRLFGPLGLAATTYDDGAKIIRHLARGYSQKVPPLRPVSPRAAIEVFAAGGVVSSASDLLKWNLALEKGSVLAPFRTRFFEPLRLRDGTPTFYAHGWMLTQHRGLGFVEHGGSYPGFDAHVIRVPTHQLIVVVLRNCEGCSPSSAVTATRLVELLVPSLQPVGRRPPSLEEAADYAGTYRDAIGEVQIRIEANTDLVVTDTGASHRLRRDAIESSDEFSVDNSLLRVRFTRGIGGHVTQALLLQRFAPSRVLCKEP